MKVMIFNNERKMWWKPNYFGYTPYQNEAGIYDYEKVQKDYPDIDFFTQGDDFYVKIGE